VTLSTSTLASQCTEYGVVGTVQHDQKMPVQFYFCLGAFEAIEIPTVHGDLEAWGFHHSTFLTSLRTRKERKQLNNEHHGLRLSL